MKIVIVVSLIWITVKICEVILPVMIDTGATPNCIATRCVEASSILRNLPRWVYTVNQILDANGQYLRPKFVISASVVIGSPAISVQCEFVVIDTLPFSCIMGQSTLSKFSSWSICNVNKYLIVKWGNYETKITNLTIILNPKQIRSQLLHRQLEPMT